MKSIIFSVFSAVFCSCIFAKFKEYRYKVKYIDPKDEAFDLKMWTELFLVSQVDGVLINDNAPVFTLKPGGGLNNVEKLKRPL